ncbi:hypothetical protein NLJ89_g2100 [Agrocybe chaxingu]|uniref:DNA replication checkpoint mediator MRC1 domain-containing protein n=1 Tax=Agrocybe chaxingu TaxID=84603 RepID=A0A9W8K6H4_9AGAR|nr:hypothetical protein NLJ89_g2100 [Agrocybe chaxingu]
MAPPRERLLQSAEEFCGSFAKKKDIDSILSLFSTTHEVSAIEHGLPALAPFLGKEFTGISEVQKYFELIGSLLSYDSIDFSEYVVDPIALKVAVKGRGCFTWLATGQSWNEIFTYTLDFDDELKVVRYQIWADSGAAYLGRVGKLEKEFSLIADSTASSSPRPDVNAPKVVIKRAARTYGRRREQPLTEDTDNSIAHSEPTPSAYDIIHNTAPPDLSDLVPSTSSPHQTKSDADQSVSDTNDASNSRLKDAFGWKAKLAAMDEDENALDSPIAPSKHDHAPKQSLFGNPLLLNGSDNSKAGFGMPTGNHRSPAAPSAPDDVFRGPVSSDQPSSPTQGETSFRLSSPQVSERIRKRTRKVVRDTDSEEEPPKDSSSTVASTSSRHLLGTPKSRSPSTQPTSEDDMPAKISAKPRLKGSRKFTNKRLSVTPLAFTEEPSSEIKATAGTKNKKTKVKVPTKKDLAETAKERGRLAAQAVVSIPRVERQPKFTVEALFAKVKAKTEALPPSDPIESFSSPVKARCASPERAATSHRPEMPAQEQPAQSDRSDSDSDLPDIGEVLKQGLVESKRKQQLQEMKKRALEAQLKAASTPAADDELEIVRADPKTTIKEEVDHRRSGKGRRVSEGRKRQLQLAHINPTKMATKPNALSPEKIKKDFATVITQHKTDAGSQAHLNQLIVVRAKEEADRLKRAKEEEWKRHGGHIATDPSVQPQGLATAFQEIAERGLQTAKTKNDDQMDVDDDGDEDEDEDWDPALRGSASPEPNEDAQGEADENNENMTLDEDITMVDDADADEENSKVSQRRRNIVASDSEEENDENAPAQPPRRMEYRRSTSSFELMTEDEQDKENDTSGLLDHSEDKENAAVRRQVSIFDLHNMRSGPSSPSTTPRDSSARRRSDLGEGSSGERRPFRELVSEESPTSTQVQPTNLTQSFAAKLQQTSPLLSTLTPAPSLRPLVGEASLKSISGFSQFSDVGDAEGFAPAPLQPGFSDLFELTTQMDKGKSRLNGGSSDGVCNLLIWGVSQLAADHDVLPFFKASTGDNDLKRNFQRTDTLALTQDLQPAFQPSGGLLRKADVIFEKEQVFVLEAHTKKPARQNTEIYVNEHGFLTQTRPPDGSPEIYRRPSPSQSSYGGSLREPPQSFSPSQTQARAPLRTISLTSPSQFDSPERSLRRLRKHDMTPTRDSNVSPSGSPSSRVKPPKLDAFQILARAQAKAKKQEEAKLRIANLGEYLQDEAAESDDDDMFGFVRPKDDEEETGEDLDKTLEILMDDREMDEDTIAADLVQDKYQEQAEQDDKEVENFHMGVIQGRLRNNKRNRGVGVDDSDEDSDTEDNDRARRAMKKLRTSDRGDIKDLAANEATRAFAETYNQSLKDEDGEFSYLNQESQLADILLGREPESQDADEEQEDEAEDSRERFITARERDQLVRETMDSGEAFQTMKPEDVSWIDTEKDDVPHIKTVSRKQRPSTTKASHTDLMEMDGTMGPAFRKSAINMNEGNRQWCAQENRSRNAGTSRSVGGSAITGHAKAKSRTGSAAHGDKGAVAGASSSASTSRPVKTAASMISVIADKRSHFA